MNRFALNTGCGLVIEEGDLTHVAADAIVNAANEALLGGGGVDGAIHRAAGPELLAACREIPEIRAGIRCPTGHARLTPGFDLPASYVIHTVGPVYQSSDVSAPRLSQAYRASLELANQHGLRTLAFPAISCGVFGYPIEEAAAISLEACGNHVGALMEIRFVLFGKEAFDQWSAAAVERF